MNYWKTIIEACRKAILVEHMFKRSRIGQLKPQDGKFQQEGLILLKHNLLERIIPNSSFDNFSPQMKARRRVEVWRLTKIFRTWVKSSMVIDCGSAINFLPQEIIDKLHWSTK